MMRDEMPWRRAITVSALLRSASLHSLIPRPGDQNPSQADPAFLRLEPPTALARQVPINEIWYQLYAQRQGVERTLSQGVRAFGLRQARYRGLAKTGLQNGATAAALNLDRLAAWLAHRPLAPTRISRFAALTA